ncbi:4'-phosphopantetheinyl transferase superfamily protein [Streptomyces sp. NPDC006314]|uniref:4'-phosphopantetheinyl transferase family protein n=1 Tax=Streptomyces sp. NPDC006314 TaxID=3154475 RepID=UPI00339E4078
MARAEGPLLRAVLPPWACGAARVGDVAPGELFEQEALVCADAGPRRRAEFTAGRWCAHRALAALGGAPAAVPRGPRGAPVWPAGVVGSITHCAGYRAAAVCRDTRGLGLGLDAEPAEPLPARVRARLLTARENALAGEMERRLPWLPVDRLLFSAREAAYKAWPSPREGPPPLRALSVESVTGPGPGPASGGFVVRLPDGYALPGDPCFHGRWHAAAGLLVTCVVIARRSPEW